MHVIEQLSDHADLGVLNTASGLGTPYLKWMVLQLDPSEDPRPKILEPERFKNGGSWKNLRLK